MTQERDSVDQPWGPEMVIHLVDTPTTRTALEEIASYNVEELRSWGEDNAADMVEIAREALGR